MICMPQTLVVTVRIVLTRVVVVPDVLKNMVLVEFTLSPIHKHLREGLLEHATRHTFSAGVVDVTELHDQIGVIGHEML